MKTIFLGFFATAAASTLCFAQELVLNCEPRHQVRSISPEFRDHIRLEKEKGRSGNAFRIVCPKDQGGAKPRNSGFQAHIQIKVESASKPVRTRVYLKGKGKGWLGLLTYDRKRRIFYPPKMLKAFTLDSPDRWTAVEHIYTPKAGTLYANKVQFVLPYISLAPGSDFLLDDWETKFIDENKTIVIED